MLEPLRPRRLRSGDRIGVVSPSWPISMSPSADPHAELERGLETLRQLGLDPVLSEHALLETGYMAGSARQRASDINAMFGDASIAAIIASHGGQVAAGVLAHLDWSLIRSHPKIFMGFSNITVLNLALSARTGLVTFHGNMVIWHLGMGPSDYDLAEFRAILMDGRRGPIGKNSDWHTTRGGEAGVGRLIGDAMGLRSVAGTPFQFPLDEDLILFFEGDSDPPGATRSYLDHLEYMGVFERTRGALVGYDGSRFSGKAPAIPFAEILADVASGYDFPILKCDDFGHASPNTVLPLGIRARLDPMTVTLELLESPVQ